jgi:hypothetical protein
LVQRENHLDQVTYSYNICSSVHIAHLFAAPFSPAPLIKEITYMNTSLQVLPSKEAVKPLVALFSSKVFNRPLSRCDHLGQKQSILLTQPYYKVPLHGHPAPKNVFFIALTCVCTFLELQQTVEG